MFEDLVPDGIVVPTARGTVEPVLDLVVQLGVTVPLVFLCSRDARAEKVIARADERGVTAFAADVRDGYSIRGLEGLATDLFYPYQGGRESDLSVKRRLGLLIAQACGWRSLLFNDDDVTITLEDVRSLVLELRLSPAVSMASEQFPDNSVVRHAGRLCHIDTPTFPSASTLLLDMTWNNGRLPFFPDIYNEDWFFFMRYTRRRHLARSGTAGQEPFDPFANPSRARREEFGDLLAEGTYSTPSTINNFTPGKMPRSTLPVPMPMSRLESTHHWSDHISIRRSFILGMLYHPDRYLSERPDVVEALRHAIETLHLIKPGHCTAYVEALKEDNARWSKVQLPPERPVPLGEALLQLGLLPYGNERKRRVTVSTIETTSDDEIASEEALVEARHLLEHANQLDQLAERKRNSDARRLDLLGQMTTTDLFVLAEECEVEDEPDHCIACRAYAIYLLRPDN